METQTHGHHDHDHSHEHRTSIAAKAPFVPGQRKTSTKLKGKKLFVSGQISCTGSRTSLSRYEEFILSHGATSAGKAAEADIVLVDTCAFNREKEQQSLQVIDDNKKAARSDAKVIVTGCLAGINPQKLRENFDGDFFSPKNEEQLAYILCLDDEENQFLTLSDPRGRFMGGDNWVGSRLYMKWIVGTATFLHKLDNKLGLRWIPVLKHLLAASQAANPQTYAVTISQGCLGQCAFCVIPMAKGRTTSMPMGLIVDKIRGVVESGVQKIILSSEDIGAYGHDIGTSFTTLLKKINEIPGDFKLYLHFFDPRWLTSMQDDLVEIVAGGKVAYMQLPLQSGSNRVLGLMRRAYRIEPVLKVVERLKAAAPRMTIGTQLIAGFPTETAADHAETKNILRRGLFDWVEVFEFSHRPGAATEKIPDHLPGETVAKRAKEIRSYWKRARYL